MKCVFVYEKLLRDTEQVCMIKTCLTAHGRIIKGRLHGQAGVFTYTSLMGKRLDPWVVCTLTSS